MCLLYGVFSVILPQGLPSAGAEENFRTWDLARRLRGAEAQNQPKRCGVLNMQLGERPHPSSLVKSKRTARVR